MGTQRKNTPAESRGRTVRSGLPTAAPAAAKGALPRKISEREWQDQVVQLAMMNGFLVAHFRPARTAHGWRTAIQGHKGFLDTVLAHAGRRLFLVVELKTDEGRLTKEQEVWLEVLRLCGIDARVWRPSMWKEIKDLLTDGRAF